MTTPKNKPKVSIIVPNYNGEKYLGETIKCLLNQDYDNLEIIIIDDGSTDGSLEIANKFKMNNDQIIILDLHKNYGESFAVNAGWRVCTGELISIVSSDDPQEVDWLSKMLEFIQNNPNHVFYYPNLRIINSSGVIEGQIELFHWNRDLIFRKMICIASAGTVINKTILPDDFMPRINEVTYPSDLIQFLELSKIGSGVRVNNVFGIWRKHDESATYNTDQLKRARIYTENVERWLKNNRILYLSTTSYLIAKCNVWIQALQFILYQHKLLSAIFKMNIFFVIRFLNPLFVGYCSYKLLKKNVMIKKRKYSIWFKNRLNKIIFSNKLSTLYFFLSNKVYYSFFLKKDINAFKILKSSDSVLEFWEISHKRNSNLWLTGTDPNWLFSYHGLIIDRNTTILNVGVGTGDCTKMMADLSKEIDVLDISKYAIEKVKNRISNGFLSSEIENLPTGKYDLIVHHLVAQHMSISELRRQSVYLLRSLAVGGMLHMQLASFLDDSNNDKLDGEDRCKSGSVGRSKKEIYSLFDKENFKFIEFVQTHTFWKYGSVWFRLKIQRVA